MSNAAMQQQPNQGVRSPSSLRDARKELGLGMPPETFGDGAVALADMCSPNARIPVAETARWRVDLPISDVQIAKTFGNRINVWGTTDGQAPDGVSTASNTLGTPGLFADDMVLCGFRIRVLVEPEGRLIKGAVFNPGASSSLPGIPDDWTQADIANNLFGLAQGQSALLPAQILYGIATWKAAYYFVNAYELFIGRSHQDAVFKQPLTETAHVEPFAMAEAAGLSFGSNQDRINELNARLSALGAAASGLQFAPSMWKRLGVVLAGGNEVSDVTPSREEDGDVTMFGGIGVPMDHMWIPLRFPLPIFWPAGKSIIIEFQVNDPKSQADFQRWLSITGGNNGNAGSDLSLPYSAQIAAVPGYTGLSPTTPGAGTMPEQSLDLAPVIVNNQVQANRCILKAGSLIFEVSAEGYRVGSPGWAPYVARAIRAGEIIAPHGYGNLVSYLQPG
jgi:hypothetical protein